MNELAGENGHTLETFKNCEYAKFLFFFSYWSIRTNIKRPIYLKFRAFLLLYEVYNSSWLLITNQHNKIILKC